MATVEVVNPKRSRKGRKRKVSSYARRWGKLRKSGMSMKAAHRALHSRKGRKSRKNSWRNDKAGHRRAAKKGHRRRKARKSRKRREHRANRRRKHRANRRRSYRRKHRANSRRFMANVRNPLGGLYPKGLGKFRGADAVGGVAGFVSGAGISSYVKGATGNEAYGVLANGLSAVGIPQIIRAIPMRRTEVRNRVARGWMVGGLIATGLDLGFTGIRYLLGQKGAIMGIEDVADLPLVEQVKTIFLQGIGNPQIAAELIKSELIKDDLVQGENDATEEELEAAEEELAALQGFVEAEGLSLRTAAPKAGLV